MAPINHTRAPPAAATVPPPANDNPRRSRAEVKDRPQDNKEQQWPVRGLKKVESAPKDNVERTLFQRCVRHSWLVEHSSWWWCPAGSSAAHTSHYTAGGGAQPAAAQPARHTTPHSSCTHHQLPACLTPLCCCCPANMRDHSQAHTDQAGCHPSGQPAEELHGRRQGDGGRPQPPLQVRPALVLSWFVKLPAMRVVSH